jgi:hypothetical protein
VQFNGPYRLNLLLEHVLESNNQSGNRTIKQTTSQTVSSKSKTYPLPVRTSTRFANNQKTSSEQDAKLSTHLRLQTHIGHFEIVVRYMSTVNSVFKIKSFSERDSCVGYLARCSHRYLHKNSWQTANLRAID